MFFLLKLKLLLKLLGPLKRFSTQIDQNFAQNDVLFNEIVGLLEVGWSLQFQLYLLLIQVRQKPFHFFHIIGSVEGFPYSLSNFLIFFSYLPKTKLDSLFEGLNKKVPIAFYLFLKFLFDLSTIDLEQRKVDIVRNFTKEIQILL